MFMGSNVHKWQVTCYVLEGCYLHVLPKTLGSISDIQQKLGTLRSLSEPGSCRFATNMAKRGARSVPAVGYVSQVGLK
jgi:hypothetical protein